MAIALQALKSMTEGDRKPKARRKPSNAKRQSKSSKTEHLEQTEVRRARLSMPPLPSPGIHDMDDVV